MNTTQATQLFIVGFSSFERATLDAFLKLAAKRNPPYLLAGDMAQADFLLVDADSTAAVDQVNGSSLLGRAVLLGATVVPGALAHLPRPLNLMLLMRALDALARPAAGVAAPPPAPQAAAAVISRAPDAPQPPADPAPPAMPPTVFGRQVADTVVQSRLDPLPPAPDAADSAEAAAKRAMDHILVVDDSDIALRFMAANLGRFGFEVHLARSGEEALQRLAERDFEMVFLDVTMPGMDGFKTCKAIKRADYRDRRHPPSVVMLTSRHTAIDKLRGTMAGCDAYLTKPLRETELLAVVGDREVKRHAFVETHRASTVL